MNVNKKAQKKILIIVIITFIITINAIVFYGINLYIKSNVAIKLDHSEIDLKIDLNNKSKGVLVPKGKVTNSNQVDMFSFEYYVMLNNQNKDQYNKLIVTVKEVVIEGTDLNHLVVIDINDTGLEHISNLSEDRVVINVTVSLLEPKDEEEYLEIINKKINITLNFRVE